VAAVLRAAWQPLSGGQQGLLAKRRRRRFLTVAVLALLAILATWLITSDIAQVAFACALTVVIVPVLATVLFGRR
jgi:hypothetical protein